MKTDNKQLAKLLLNQPAEEAVRLIFEKYGGRAALASSLGVEDQVLTHMAAAADKKARIFIIDTGVLHRETYELLDITKQRYSINPEVYSPDHNKVQGMIEEYGQDMCYRSIELRKLCCETKKLEPLRRALSTVDVWITGLRREQSTTRSGVEIIEWDEANSKIKVNPLAEWSNEEVWSYIQENNVPYNSLHDRGFPSIGCEPCTRAINPGEDIRAGRWWWEKPEQKECGLHRRPEVTKR